MNKITCFTMTSFLIGLFLSVATMHFYFHWQLIPALTALVTGGFLLFSLFMFLLALMSLFL